MKKDQSPHLAEEPTSVNINPNIPDTQPDNDQSQEQLEPEQMDQKKKRYSTLNYENAAKYPLRRITIFDNSSIV